MHIAVNYTSLSMAYYAYDSTANFGSTVLSKEWHSNKELSGFEPLGSYGDFSEGKLNANGLELHFHWY